MAGPGMSSEAEPVWTDPMGTLADDVDERLSGPPAEARRGRGAYRALRLRSGGR